MTENSQVEVINIEINKQLANAEVGRALLATTFKGLTAQSMKQAIMEGMIRGFKFKDFLEKNVYAIPYGQTYSLVTSIDYARKRGMRAGIVGKSAPVYETDGNKIISCSVTVQRRSPLEKQEHIVGNFTATVYFDEYSTGKNLWVNKPRTMIAKVAEMHALRMACPEELSQMYSEEEMEREVVHAQPTRMEPYEVPRKEIVDEDEAGGSGAKVAERHEEVQELVLDPKKQRLEIANLLKKHHKFTVLGKSEEEVESRVMDITGIAYSEENYAAIIEDLSVSPSGIKY